MFALLGLAAVVAVTAVFLSWTYRAPQDLTWSGWIHADMPTYVCYARMAAQSPTTLSYANPHDLRDDPPALLVNLPITLMGWLLALGLEPRNIEHALRLIFGPLMYLAIGVLLRPIFRRGPWFWGAFVIVGFGGGCAWLAAVFDVGVDVPDFARRWHHAVRAVQEPYYWWFLDTFRNLWYPLELAYHAMLFGQLWALATRRYRLSVVLLAVACASHPFTGIEACGLQLATLALAWVYARPRPTGTVLAASVGVAVVFVAYYGLLLPLDDTIRSVQAQHTGDYFNAPLGLQSTLLGHGVALLAPLPLVLDRDFRRHALSRFHLVPVVVIVVWTALLTQNSRLPFELHLQPMHFTRGYIHAGLWIVLLAWLQYRLAAPWAPRRAGAVAIALAILALPDSILFVEHQYLNQPQWGGLIWPRDIEEIHEILRREPSPRRVIARSWTLGKQICAQHEHRSAFGTPQTTPYYRDRVAEIEQFAQDPTKEPPVVRWSDIQVANTAHRAWVSALRRSARWEEVACNPSYCVFRRVAPPPPE